MLPTELNDHPIHATLGNFLTLQKSDAFLERGKTLTDDQKSQRDYVFSTVRELRSKLKTAKNQLISANGLRQLNEQLTRSFSEVSAFQNGGDLASISNAVTHAEEATRTAIWAVPTKPAEIDASWHDEMAALTQAFEEAIAKVQEKEKGFGERVDGLYSRVEEFGQKIIEYDSQASAANENLDAAFNRIGEQYELMQGRVEQSSQKEIDAFRDEVKRVIKNKEMLVDHLMRQLQDQKDKATQIVQVVANIGTTGNYSNMYVSESATADKWRLITVGLFGFGIFLTGGTLAVHIYEEFFNPRYQSDTLSLLLRFVVGMVVALPAFYTARESARHRSNADRAKQTELELATLDPFIEFLPSEKKYDLKAKLSEKYFGNGTMPHTVESPIFASQFTSLLEQLNKLVDRIRSNPAT